LFHAYGLAGWRVYGRQSKGAVLLTANALSMVDPVLAGYEHKHYFAREIYYSGTQNGPHVVVYLSDDIPVLMTASSVFLGAGVRVECYTSMTTNLGAQRLTVANYNGGNVSWGVQDLVLGSCRPTLIGGVRYDIPAAVAAQNNKASMATAAAAFSSALLSFFVCVALFWRLFDRR